MSAPPDLRALTKRIFEHVISGGDLALADALIAPDFTDHRGPPGRDGFKLGLQMVREAFPDWTSAPIELVVEGDKVAARWVVRGTHRGPFLGFAPTGRAIEMAECGILRFEGGQLVELNRVADELSLLRQLGAPAPA